jgi:DNA invertase Pin-like site-specific DNA recombinase
MQKAIAYYRVSTKRQGRSGLGLEAQVKAIADFAKGNNLLLIEGYQETKSGERNGRIGLQAAMAACKKENAILVIAKLDRLSRSVAFIATLMESKVAFVVVDMPDAEPFVLHIHAAFAQKELVELRLRTKLSLAAAKARGVVLGKFGRYVLSERNRERAKNFAEKMRPIIERLRRRGIKTVRAIAAELNRLHIPTYRKDNAHWHSNTVHRLISRIDKRQ